MAALYFILLCISIQLHLLSAFMPNYVFLFKPNSSDDNNLSEDYFFNPDNYPVEKEYGLVDDESHTHQDIIRHACLQEVARFYEDTLTKPAGSLQDLQPLTAETLLKTVFGRNTSSLNLELALQEIEVQAALMDAWYEVDATTTDQATAIALQHFDNEEIKGGHDYLLEKATSIFTSLHAKSYSAARTFLGRYFLTLQDFYSHSNWVELGNRDILFDLGNKKGAPFLNDVAGPGTDTCSDCSHCGAIQCADCKTCTEDITTQKITSGYFMYSSQSEKPFGKCSHGGETDRSRRTSPTGGINKSTKNCRKSPHNNLHDEAVSLAKNATRKFLERVRNTTGSEKFRKLFNLAQVDNVESATSLCFVIDQTGSMQDDIDAVKNRTRQIIKSGTKPYNYVLVQFGDYDKDPAFGPPFVTNDAVKFLAELDNLQASDGGDCPELTLHGLQLALTRCLPGSSIFIFTDAGVKDVDLTQTVYSLIDQKGSQIYIFYTGRARYPCSYNPFLFKELTERSGGQVLQIKRETVVKATVLTQTITEGATTMLLAVKKRARSGKYSVFVDCTITTLTVSVTGYQLVVEIYRPDGSVYSRQLSLTESHLVIVVPKNDIVAGKWTVVVERTSSPEHSVIIQAATSVDFLYQFVQRGGRPGHMGVFPIIGKPPQKQLAKVVLTVAGLSSLAKVSDMIVVSESGVILGSHPLEQGQRGSSNLFGTAFLPPPQPFRLGLRAIDECNHPVTRLVNTIITPQPFIAKLDNPISTNQLVKPGNRSHVSFKLYPSDESSTVTVTVNLDEFGDLEHGSLDVLVVNESEYVRSRRSLPSVGRNTLTRTVSLKKGQIAIVTFSFSVAKDADVGRSSSATVVVSEGESFSYIPVEVVVDTKVTDNNPPLCNIHIQDKLTCPIFLETCHSAKWYIIATVVDSELGLHNIQSTSPAVNITHRDLERNNTIPVDVKAVASCCQREVTLQVSDVAGNIETCSVSLPPLKSNDSCEGLNYKSSGEELMRKFLRWALGLPPGAELTSKQFSFGRKRKVVRVWFRDADTDKNSELSKDELEDYAISLFERNYISEKCSLWLMKKCFQSHSVKMDRRALWECFGVATRQSSDS